MFGKITGLVVLTACIFFVQDTFGLTRPSVVRDPSLSGSGQLQGCNSGSVPCPACTPGTNCVNTLGIVCSPPAWGFNGVNGCSLPLHPPCYYYLGCNAGCSCGMLVEALCPGAPVAGACKGSCTMNPFKACICTC
jgi:hypothetical protein